MIETGDEVADIIHNMWNTESTKSTAGSASSGYNKASRKQSDDKRCHKRQRNDLRKKIQGNWSALKAGRKPAQTKKTTRFYRSNLDLANIKRLQTNLWRRASSAPKENNFLKTAARNWPTVAAQDKGDDLDGETWGLRGKE